MYNHVLDIKESEMMILHCLIAMPKVREVNKRRPDTRPISYHLRVGRGSGWVSTEKGL